MTSRTTRTMARTTCGRMDLKTNGGGSVDMAVVQLVIVWSMFTGHPHCVLILPPPNSYCLGVYLRIFAVIEMSLVGSATREQQLF